MVNEITTEKFNELIKKEKGIVVVDFFADWCMPCVMMAPVLDSLAKVNKKVTFAKINVDDNSDLAQEYEISSIPCIVFLKNGKEVDRMVGAGSEDALQERINSLG